jgi:hypothetical protein
MKLWQAAVLGLIVTGAVVALLLIILGVGI